MRHVLIIGGGLAGAYTARACLRSGLCVTIADRSPRALRWSAVIAGGPLKTVSVDVHHIDDLGEVAASQQFEAVIVAVGISGAAAHEEPRKAVNHELEGVQNILHVARKNGIGKLVYLSSLAVYGRPPVDRVWETTPVAPATAYGEAKVAAEEVLLSCADDKLHIHLLRCSGLYGACRRESGSRSARLIRRLLLTASTTDRVQIVVETSCWDQYLYVEDLARAVTCALLVPQRKPLEVFNVGPGKMTGEEALCAAIEAVLPRTEILLSLGSGLRSPCAPVMDVTKAWCYWGFSPRYSLQSGFYESLVEWSD